MKHPMQPIELADDDVIRFKRNRIVKYMLDAGSEAGIFNLNTIARGDFPSEDHEQLAQLIGYSVSGFGDLSYVSPESIDAADDIAAELYNSLQSG
jgi:hypothetical protein